VSHPHAEVLESLISNVLRLKQLWQNDFDHVGIEHAVFELAIVFKDVCEALGLHYMLESEALRDPSLANIVQSDRSGLTLILENTLLTAARLSVDKKPRFTSVQLSDDQSSPAGRILSVVITVSVARTICDEEIALMLQPFGLAPEDMGGACSHSSIHARAQSASQVGPASRCWWRKARRWQWAARWPSPAALRSRSRRAALLPRWAAADRSRGRQGRR